MNEFNIDHIKILINLKTENKNLDYKEFLNWSANSTEDKLSIVKDILAMSNTQDGGKIIFGVKDGDYSFVGLNKSEYESFDPTKLNDFLHKHCDPQTSCAVYKQEIDNKFVIIVDVPEFKELPIICKADANSSEKPYPIILKKGQLYIRTEKGTSQAISSSEEMRELLTRATQKKGDDLLSNIEKLIKGKAVPSEAEDKKKYNEEILEAEIVFKEKIKELFLPEIGYWEVIFYPTKYNANRFVDQSHLQEIIQKSKVYLRGWDFPHVDTHGAASNFSKGFQSYTEWSRYREGFRAYTSGLFTFKQALWEDADVMSKTKDKPALGLVSAIYSILEYFLFFKRFYENIPVESLSFTIKLNNSMGRTYCR